MAAFYMTPNARDSQEEKVICVLSGPGNAHPFHLLIQALNTSSTCLCLVGTTNTEEWEICFTYVSLFFICITYYVARIIFNKNQLGMSWVVDISSPIHRVVNIRPSRLHSCQHLALCLY